MAIIFSKNKKRMVKLSISLMADELNILEFMNILETEPKVLKWFNRYSSRNLYSSFSSFDTIKTNMNNFNIRIFVYQLIYAFLTKEKIKFEKKIYEYVFYDSMSEQCPEWFQCDYNLLRTMFNNLEKLVGDNMLKSEIEKVCLVMNSYPIWLQNPEWIVENGIPYIFVNQTANPNDFEYDGSEIKYTFKNKFTNELKVVTQYD